MKKKIFVIAVIILAISRLLLTANVPIQQIGNAVIDDALTVFAANNLKQGKWQGVFLANTLIKGVTCPFLIAISSILNIPYTFFVTSLYIISTLVFLYALSKYIRNRYILLAIYVFILFNPIMMSIVIQRVYRNSFVPTLSLFIFSFYLIMFADKKRNLSDFVLYNILIGIAFALFYNLREDIVWICPFMLFLGICIIVDMIKAKEENRKVKIVLLALPILITIIVNNIICFINYQYYGIYKRLNIFDFNFYNLIRTIDYGEMSQDVSLNEEKIEKLCECSPTLNEIKGALLTEIDDYKKMIEQPVLYDAYLGWVLRDAMCNSGIYETATKSNEFCDNVYKELKEAVKRGDLKTVSSIHYINFYDVVCEIGKACEYICRFQGMEFHIDIKSAIGPEFMNYMYEDITHNTMIYTDEDLEKYNYTTAEEQNDYLQKNNWKEKALNTIIKTYRSCGNIAFVTAMISYITITIEIIRKKYENINIWVILSGMIGSAFSLACVVGIVEVISKSGINEEYLAGAFAPIIIFNCIAIYSLIRRINIGKFKSNI